MVNNSWNPIDPNLTPANIKNWIDIFGVTWTLTEWLPQINGVTAWYQITRREFYTWNNANQERWQSWMLETPTHAYQIFFWRCDGSNDYTRMYMMRLDKSTLALSYYQQNINCTSSGWSPFWVQQAYVQSITWDWADEIKVIYGVSWNDGEVLFNISTNNWHNNSYSRNSNNKVPFANNIKPNNHFDIGGIAHWISMSARVTAHNDYIMDPQLLAY